MIVYLETSLSDDTEDENTNTTGNADVENVHGRNGYLRHRTETHHAAFRGSNQCYFPPGPTYAVQDLTSLIDFFSFFLDASTRANILVVTNSRLSSDVDAITDEEQSGFMGILLLLAVTKKQMVPLSDVWRDSSLHYIESIALCMARNRFFIIAKYLTFYDLSLIHI